MQKSYMRLALTDASETAKRYSLVGMLGWQDVRQRYRRSALGPFWLTISMGVMIATIGVVFGSIFKTPMVEFFPFLSIGLILWTFMSTTVTEGCAGFIAAEGVIKQLALPLPVHIARVVWRNTIILAHNIIILPLVLLVVGRSLEWTALIAIPGLLLLILNLTWITLLLAIVCARYRDLPQIVTSVLPVAMYLTPIIWMPSLLPERAGLYLLHANPVFHALELVRGPLLGDIPTWMNWIVSLGLLGIGCMATLALYGRYRGRIAYWL